MSHCTTFDERQGIAYRSLMMRLADVVGRHQLPVRADAADINELLDSDPVHGELVREVVRSIYRAGRCSHLDCEIHAETVFNALGSIRGRLLGDVDTDVDQVNLLEELGWAARTLFAPASPVGHHAASRPEREDPPPVVLRYPAL